MPEFLTDGNGGRGCSATLGRGPGPPRDGVKGVSGVLGVDIYRPLHFGQRVGLSAEAEDDCCKPFVFPARLGWYR